MLVYPIISPMLVAYYPLLWTINQMIGGLTHILLLAIPCWVNFWAGSSAPWGPEPRPGERDGSDVMETQLKCWIRMLKWRFDHGHSWIMTCPFTVSLVRIVLILQSRSSMERPWDQEAKYIGSIPSKTLHNDQSSAMSSYNQQPAATQVPSAQSARPPAGFKLWLVLTCEGSNLVYQKFHN